MYALVALSAGIITVFPVASVMQEAAFLKAPQCPYPEVDK